MNILHNIKSIFHILVIFQCLLFSSYLLTQKNGKRLSNRILVAFLLAKAVTDLGGFLSHFLELKEYVLVHFPKIFYLDYTFQFLYVPLLYFYFMSLSRKDFRLKKIYMFHAIPFFIVFLLVFFRVSVQSTATIREIVRSNSFFASREAELFMALGHIQFFIYAIASIALIKKYRKEIKHYFSSLEKINLSWLAFVIFGFAGWRLLHITEYIIWVLSRNPCSIYLYIASEIVFLVFVSLMFLRGLNQPEIFAGIEKDRIGQKYEKTLLPEKVKEAYKRKLIQYMDNEKPYLNPLLSLNDLAKLVAVPAHHLSQVINSCFNQNFFDFINSYRIKESQRLLADKNNGKRTILEVLYETGFNSKSVFNTAFKRHTGMTPSKFRKLQES
jgi:AraC-like DNA-binding protein